MNERWECGECSEDPQIRFADTVWFRLQRSATWIAEIGHEQTMGDVKYTLWAPIEGWINEVLEYQHCPISSKPRGRFYNRVWYTECRLLTVLRYLDLGGLSCTLAHSGNGSPV